MLSMIMRISQGGGNPPASPKRKMPKVSENIVFVVGHLGLMEFCALHCIILLLDHQSLYCCIEYVNCGEDALYGTKLYQIVHI